MNTQRPLHIGLDVDGVLADYVGAMVSVGRAHGHVMDGADRGPTSYGLVEPGWFPHIDAAERAMAQVHTGGGLADLALLDETAPEAVRQLRRAGHRVSIVTARDEKWGYRSRGRDDLIAWLRRHRISSDAVHFEQHKHRIGCDVYLDDTPHNIEMLRHHGHLAVVRHTTYNVDVEGPRVHSLAEFAELVLAGDLTRGAA